MRRRHSVHVVPVPGRGWLVRQSRRTLSYHRTQANAVRAAKREARRDLVELVTHARTGRIRAKDSYGYETKVRDTER